MHVPTALEPIFASGLFNQQPPHCNRGCSKEMATGIPMLDLFRIDNAQVSVVNKRSCLERLTRFFMSKLRGSQFPQFIIDQWQ
jgi:hypothetical protein